MVTNSFFNVNRLFCIFFKIYGLFSIHFANYLNIQIIVIRHPFLFCTIKGITAFAITPFMILISKNLISLVNSYSSTIESLLPIASFGIGFASTQILPGRPASFAPLKTTVRCPKVSKLDWAISPTAVMRYSF